MAKFSFSRESRLLTPLHFKFVFEQPLRAATPQLTILSRINHLDYPRLGLTIAKKQVKKAAHRNRIKRLCRESFRLKQHDLPAVDIVVIAKKGAEKMDNASILALLEKLWQRHIRLSLKH